MANAFTLFGEISVDTAKLDSELKKAEQSLNRTAGAFGKAEGAARSAAKGNDAFANSTKNANKATAAMGDKLQTLGGGFQSAGLALSATLTAPLVALAYSSVNTAKDMESLQMGLKAVTKEAGPLSAQLTRLKEVAKLPGLGLKEAIQGSINLQATGLSANTAERALMAFGNALATVGKGKAELSGVITALSQIQSKGKVSAEEINQLAERLPQIRVAMQAAFGTADTEALAKMGITANTFIEQIIGEFEKLPKVGQTSALAFENFADAVEAAILPLGQAILPILISAMEAVTPIIQQVSTAFANAGPMIQTAVLAIGALVALAGPVLLFVGTILSMAGAIAAGVAALGGLAAIKVAVVGALAAAIPVIVKVGLVLAALAAAAVALYIAYQQNFGGLKDAVTDSLTAIEAAYKRNEAVVRQFWADNGQAIMQAIDTIATFGKQVIQILEPVFRFVVGTGKSAFSGLIDVVTAAFRIFFKIVATNVAMIANVINGDWRKNWDLAKSFVSDMVDGILNILGGLVQMVLAPFRGILAALKGRMPEFLQTSFDIGDALIDGIVNALRGGWSSVWAAAQALGAAAIAAIKKTLGVASPSKVFYGIGKDVVQGFIDGIDAMRSSAVATLANLVPVEMLGKVLKGKIGGEVLNWYKGLIDQQLSATATTERQKLEIMLLGGEFKKLPEDVKNAMRAFADGIDTQIKSADNAEKLKDRVKELREELEKLGKVELNKFEKLLRELSDPAVSGALGRIGPIDPQTGQSVGMLNSELEKLRVYIEWFKESANKFEVPKLEIDRGITDDTGIASTVQELPDIGKPPTGAKEGWDAFFDHIKKRMEEWRNDTKDMGKVLGTVLTDSLGKAADIFASAVANWDGTWKGFVKSIASGFRQLAQQIIQQLIQIAIMRVMAGLGLGAAGGAGGVNTAARGAATNAAATSMAGVGSATAGIRFATGGLVSGPGTAMSDSIPAMLSNGEFVIPASSVRRFGVDFFESLRKGQMPMRRYAMGGMVTPTASSVSTSNSTSNYNNVFNIAVPSGSNQQQTAAMVQSQILAALRKHEQRNK